MANKVQLLYTTLLYKDSVSSPAPIANRVVTLSHLTLCTTSHYGSFVPKLIFNQNVIAYTNHGYNRSNNNLVPIELRLP